MTGATGLARRGSSAVDLAMRHRGTARRKTIVGGLVVIGLGLLVSLALAPSALAGYDDGVLAYDSGRYEAALAEFRPLVAAGHPGAEFMVGAMYFYGKGAPRDDALAAAWFHKAARQGHGGAQLAYGSLHIRGLGVLQDFVKAYMWLTLASESDIDGLRHQAVLLRAEAARMMARSEVERAQGLAQRWEPRSAGLTLDD